MSPFVSHRIPFFLSKERLEFIEGLRQLIAEGSVVPQIDRAFELDEAGEAVQAIEAGTLCGKAVISIPSPNPPTSPEPEQSRCLTRRGLRPRSVAGEREPVTRSCQARSRDRLRAGGGWETSMGGIRARSGWGCNHGDLRTSCRAATEPRSDS